MRCITMALLPLLSLGCGSLHDAARDGDLEALDVYVDEGADLDHSDPDGRTALGLAAAAGHTDTVRALLRAGARANVADADGSSPLHHACARGDRATVDLLLSHGADINATDKAGRAPLIAALDGGHWNLAKHLSPRSRLVGVPSTEAFARVREGDELLKAASGHKQVEAAIDAYRAATRLAPFWAQPWRNMGFAYLFLERPWATYPCLRRYLLMAPHAPDAWKLRVEMGPRWLGGRLKRLNWLTRGSWQGFGYPGRWNAGAPIQFRVRDGVLCVGYLRYWYAQVRDGKGWNDAPVRFTWIPVRRDGDRLWFSLPIVRFFRGRIVRQEVLHCEAYLKNEGELTLEIDSRVSQPYDSAYRVKRTCKPMEY